MIITDDENSFRTPPISAEDDEQQQTYYSATEELNPQTKSISSLNYTVPDYVTYEARLEAGIPTDYKPYRKYQDDLDTYRPTKSWRRYSEAMQTLKPVRFKKEEDKMAMPVDNIGFISFVSYNWLTSRMWKAYRLGYIPVESIPKCSPLEGCDLNCKRLAYIWQKEVQEKGPGKASLHRAIWRFMRTRMLVGLLFFVISLVTGFVGPTIFMRKLLEYVQKKDVDYTEGFTWLTGLFIMECVRVIMFAAMWSINYRTALRLRSACLALVFHKVLRLRNLGDKSIGEFINLFANDGARIFDFVTYGPLIIGGPVVAVGGVIFIGWLLGLPALAGMATFILFYPFQYLISRLTGYFRRKTILVTDERVRFMNEMLNSIKLIKLYAWEKPFTQKISDIRNKERKLLEKSAYVQSVSIAMAPTVPIIAAIVTFLAHVGAGNNLTAAEAFTVMTVMCMLNFAFRVVPIYANQIVNGRIAFQRFQSVLLMEDNVSFVVEPANKDEAVCITNGTFAWDTNFTQKKEKKKRKNKSDKLHEKLMKNNNVNGEEQISLANEEEVPLTTPKIIYNLHDINLVLKKRQLIGVCGAVGAGKSSLLSAILGQMRLIKGQVALQGSCAYVTQQAWLLNATLQENVLFEELLDNKSYYEALTCCCLIADIESLPAGDQTEIGERGINLSGGQKQRVSLARAVYSDRDVYLLDDPLSAVDAHVGQHIFTQCIQGVLKDKSVILVTHQLQYLSSCDYVIFMKDGGIAEHGTHEALMNTKRSEYANLIHTFLAEEDSPLASDLELSIPNIPKTKTRKRPISPTKPSNENKEIDIKAGKLITEEKIERGNIAFATYQEYMKAGGGYFISLIVLLTFAVNIGTTAFSSWWLSRWINEGGGGTEIYNAKTNTTEKSVNITDNPNLEMYQSVYGDVRLPFTAEIFLQNLWVTIFSLLFVSLVFPYFLIPLVGLSAIFFFLYSMFHVSIRELKRIENVSRSPVYGHVTSTMQGLSTIHAYGKEKEFIDKFVLCMDNNTGPFYLFNCGMRWLALRLDLLVVSITLCTGLFVVLSHNQVPAAYAGLALAYAAQLSGLFQYTVRLSTETEARFTSVERFSKLNKNLITERPSINESYRTPSDWPSKGLIEFEDVCLRYRPELPLVLKRLNFVIEPNEKIGIVGRTGSGKSSLGVALFQLTELASGHIFIDNLDIGKLGLEELRSRMSLIPQDPILFIGTVRYNLDPFNLYADEEIWSALEKTYMKEKIVNLLGGLSAPVVENGENFSVGERQLLCMARALLRKSKILLLDEATASIDTETDSLIQITIREAFEECTILTIAHRLPTVLNCNRVIVMQDGEIIEMNKPSVLLATPNSLFAGMMAASADSKFTY
uniref:Multidrug resistance-associated protein 5 n=1 Tax=Strigamia maritima TaxID=126957 RepID=T1J568_STRMM